MVRFVPYISPGAYTITANLYKVHRDGTIQSEIPSSDFDKMQVVCNENVAIKRTLTIDTDNPGVFRPFEDYLMPYLTITDPEGNSVSGPQGLYIVVPSGKKIGQTSVTGTVEARDLTQLLTRATFTGMVCPSGLDRGEFIRRVMLGMGFNLGSLQVPDFGVLQSEDRPWDPGTTAIDILTDMATGSNYYQPWFDNRGVFVTSPYAPLTNVAPSLTYSNKDDNSSADIEGIITQTPDWGRLANKVTVRRLGDELRPTISWTAVNDNANSPVSVTNLGMEMAKETVDNPDLEDEAAAEVQANQLLSESSSHYVKLSLPTFPVIDAGVHETVSLDIITTDGDDLTGTFWRTGYTLSMTKSNASMIQELARVEEWRT